MKANPQTSMNHQVPSRSPPLNQPPLIAHSKRSPSPTLSENPLPVPHLLFKVCPKMREAGVGQVGTSQPPTLSISGRVPKEIPPQETHPTYCPRPEPSNTQRANPKSRMEQTPISGNPGLVTANPQRPGRTCSRCVSRGG